MFESVTVVKVTFLSLKDVLLSIDMIRPSGFCEFFTPSPLKKLFARYFLVTNGNSAEYYALT